MVLVVVCDGGGNTVYRHHHHHGGGGGVGGRGLGHLAQVVPAQVEEFEPTTFGLGIKTPRKP